MRREARQNALENVLVTITFSNVVASYLEYVRGRRGEGRGDGEEEKGSALAQVVLSFVSGSIEANSW
jgi:hypothetical protein